MTARSPLLDGLRSRYLPRLVAAAGRCLERCADGLDAHDPASVAGALHVLAGEASALGVDELSAAAAEAERVALAWRADPARLDACAHAVATLARAAALLSLPAASPDPNGAIEGGGRRVLVVDDSALGADAVCDALEDAGLEARAAHDPAAAIDAMAVFRPAVVLTDVHMPGLDAVELCRALRCAASGERPRIVLMSGASDDELAAALGRTGADAAVSKHGGMPAIVAAVSDMVGEAR